MAETREKKVFLVAAFRNEEAESSGPGPTTGTAVDVVALIGMCGDHHRFEWVGPNEKESIANPALVTPVKVRLALPSPWHDEDDGMLTGLVQLDTSQLSEGTIDEDIDHLLAELRKSRGGQ